MQKITIAQLIELALMIIIAGVLWYHVGYNRGFEAGKKEATTSILKLADQMLNEQLDQVDKEAGRTNDIGSTNIQSLGDG